MNSVPHRSRRGSALLFVLAALALVLPVCLGLAKTVTTVKLDRELRQDEQLLDELLREADAPIQEWLGHQGQDVVLPPDLPFPAVLVLDEEIADADAQLRIVAWDQCGLVPLAAARGGSILRLALPREITGALDRHRRESAWPGLDWFADEGETGGPFPPTPTVESRDGESRLVWTSAVSTTLGARVATHNPGVVNVSTAPIALVEAALRESGRTGGLEPIIAARREMKRAPVPSAQAGNVDADQRGLQFASTSTCWSFRVDARVRRVRRSAWLVYQPTDSRWRCVQRLLIND